MDGDHRSSGFCTVDSFGASWKLCVIWCFFGSRRKVGVLNSPFFYLRWGELVEKLFYMIRCR